MLPYQKNHLNHFIMKKLLLIIIVTLSIINTNAQSLNNDKVALANFVKRMYSSSPFEASKVIDDINHKYFITILSLEKAKYSSQSVMNRVAQVKAQSQRNQELDKIRLKNYREIAIEYAKNQPKTITYNNIYWK